MTITAKIIKQRKYTMASGMMDLRTVTEPKYPTFYFDIRSDEQRMEDRSRLDAQAKALEQEVAEYYEGRAMTKKQIREGLIKAGIKNLKEFGYPHASAANILTDLVYKKVFVSMLKSDENVNVRRDIEEVRLELLKELA